MESVEKAFVAASKGNWIEGSKQVAKALRHNVTSQKTNCSYSSGSGSDLHINKKQYIPFLQTFIIENKIKTVVELGCGTFNIGPDIYRNLNIIYFGYDVQDETIKQNQETYKYFFKKYNFFTANLLNEKSLNALEPADLCIIKDVIQHWPTEYIEPFLDYLIASGKYNYILIVNCYDTSGESRPRKNIKFAEFDYLSFNSEPLNKYNVENIDDKYDDKYYGNILGYYATKEVSLIYRKSYIYNRDKNGIGGLYNTPDNPKERNRNSKSSKKSFGGGKKSNLTKNRINKKKKTNKKQIKNK